VDANWDRIRFRTWSVDDPRPVKFPPPGPYWVTGEALDPNGDYSTIVAYFPAGNREAVKDFWPDTDLDAWDGFSIQHDQPIEFTDRFPPPRWWTPLPA
jgi:hypothetical protein